MSDMNFEHIDNLAKQAAAQSQPEFDEQAWANMNEMLDKEFGKNKRRFAFWWLLPALLLMGTATYLVMKNNAIENKAINIANTENIKNTQQPDVVNNDKQTNNTAAIANDKKVTAIANNKTEKTNTQPTVVSNQNKPVPFSTPLKLKIISNTDVRNHGTVAPKIVATQPTINATDATKEQEKVMVNINANKTNTSKENLGQLLVINSDSINNFNKTTDIVAIDSANKKQIDSVKTVPTVQKIKQKDKALSNWSVTASTAIDGSFVRINEMQQATLLYGAGVNYSINKRWSIATGFYAGKKIYYAAKDDYNPKYNPAPSTWNIRNYDADCYVFDIPLNIRYNFINTKKNTFYAVTGLSSFIMKRETYNVWHNYGGTTPYLPVTWEYENKNNNFFSVLNLSVGFEKQMNHNLFLSVEPYYKLPLGGVGQGQVKLSSVGMQLNARYQFNKKTKR